MNKSLRKAIVAGNWKMNNDRKAAKALITELAPMVKDAGCEVVLCVPFTNLETAFRCARAPTSMSARRTATGQPPAPSPAKFPP